MIPTRSRIDTVRKEHEDLVAEVQGEDDGIPYFEYEWFGVTHSYSAAGFWLRILLVAILSVFVELAFLVAGYYPQALIFLLIIGAAILASLVMLRNYRIWH